jgi:hypothetical protein
MSRGFLGPGLVDGGGDAAGGVSCVGGRTAGGVAVGWGFAACDLAGGAVAVVAEAEAEDGVTGAVSGTIDRSGTGWLAGTTGALGSCAADPAGTPGATAEGVDLTKITAPLAITSNAPSTKTTGPTRDEGGRERPRLTL